MPFFDLPQDWSAEQAIAVSDLLEQLRDTILAQYHEQIRDTSKPSASTTNRVTVSAINPPPRRYRVPPSAPPNGP